MSLVEHRAGKLRYFDTIDTDQGGIITVAEMKAARTHPITIVKNGE